MKKYCSLFLALPLLLGNTDDEGFKHSGTVWQRISSPISADVVRQILPGMSRRQVREILGTPHFGEGIFVSQWHYLFDISAKSQVSGLACQLRINFEKGRVTDMKWQRDDCKKLV